MSNNFRIRSRDGRWETGLFFLSLRQVCLNTVWVNFRLRVGYAVAWVDTSGLSWQRDAFDAGPVRVNCCNGQTGIETGVSPMNSVFLSQGQ